MSKQTDWQGIKTQFLHALKEHGLDEEVWAEMRFAAIASGGEDLRPTTDRPFYGYFEDKFLREGIDPATAERMARIAVEQYGSRERGDSLFDSYRAKFEDEGKSPEQAARMARIAARGRPGG